MSAAPVRRSQRGKQLNYKVGDLVEIVVNAGVSTGRLVKQLTSGSPSNTRWYVTFDDEDTKDIEVLEKNLGKVVEDDIYSHQHQSPTGLGNTNNNQVKQSTKGSRRGTSQHSGSARSSSRSKPSSGSENISSSGSVESSENGVASVSMSASATSKQSNKKKAANTASENSTSTKKASKTATKASKKTMAKKPRANSPTVNGGVSTRLTRKSPLVSGTQNNNTTTTTTKKGNKRARKTKEEYTKVVLLTGTLYLYKGENPRAVFVRKY